MITYTNDEVWKDSGAPSLEAIAVGLSRLPRFAGQTKTFYTVLCHSLTCAQMASPEARIHLLLHDAAESMVSDIPTTLKTIEQRQVEVEILRRIYERYDLELPTAEISNEIEQIDHACLVAEAYLLGHAQATKYWPLDSDTIKIVNRAMMYTMRRIASGQALTLLINPEAAIKGFYAEFEEARLLLAIGEYGEDDPTTGPSPA